MHGRRVLLVAHKIKTNGSPVNSSPVHPFLSFLLLQRSSASRSRGTCLRRHHRVSSVTSSGDWSARTTRPTAMHPVRTTWSASTATASRTGRPRLSRQRRPQRRRGGPHHPKGPRRPQWGPQISERLERPRRLLDRVCAFSALLSW